MLQTAQSSKSRYILNPLFLNPRPFLPNRQLSCQSNINQSRSAANTLYRHMSSSNSTANAAPKPRIEDAHRRVRVLFNKKYVADTKGAKFVWEHPYYPIYYLPAKDVQTKYIEKIGTTEDGEGDTCKLKVGDRTASKVTWFQKGEFSGLIKFTFSEMGTQASQL